MEVSPHPFWGVAFSDTGIEVSLHSCWDGAFDNTAGVVSFLWCDYCVLSGLCSCSHAPRKVIQQQVKKGGQVPAAPAVDFRPQSVEIVMEVQPEQ